ncbi:(R)-mandelonitrile lyase [Ovoidimarina sediminis]|uniref:(R)-mandelonitrile lyase n=1 Tax=Ovoidimarina sediminis TaxID=3079856 RepID=UPI00291122CC|nr:cupin domain-containing protein [Rhodophyticola sp. MJ-SS7]MDU8943050.1 cupin domain-containing protein [Rhodophyticola sp. MJ-SS7]
MAGETMIFSPKDTRPASRMTPDWFTGEVDLVRLIEAPEPARLRASVVTFQPGARTNWHTHPLGQTLYVISGRGRAQREGEPIVEFGPGDVLFFAPGERHWHGAAPDCDMVHVAMQEALDGSHIDWAEPVTDEQYGG